MGLLFMLFLSPITAVIIGLAIIAGLIESAGKAKK